MTEQPSDPAAAPPLLVVATVPARAGSQEVVREALRTLAAATREEEGCLAYAVFESGSMPGMFLTTETWRSRADLDAHMGTPHVAAAFAAVADALAGEVGLHPLVPMA